jgi:hypothetical protein
MTPFYKINDPLIKFKLMSVYSYFKLNKLNTTYGAIDSNAFNMYILVHLIRST